MAYPASPAHASDAALRGGAFGERDGGCPVGGSTGPGGPLAWRGGWCTTLGLLAAGLSTSLWLKPADDPRWSATNGFDEEGRELLRAGSRSARDDDAAASDGLLAFGFLLPHLDAALFAFELEDEGRRWRFFELMEQTNLNLQLANLTLTNLTKAVASRERPFVRRCAADPGYAPGCGHSADENDGFFSGHTSTVFAGAGLVCARHAAFDYERLARRSPRANLAVGVAACTGSLLAGAATGLLRMAADRHYASDVLVGAATGFAWGFLTPWLWEREAWEGSAVPAGGSVRLAPLVGSGIAGLAVTGAF